MAAGTTSVMLLLGVVCIYAIPTCTASNYDALIHDINRRSQYSHDAFMDRPGVREQVRDMMNGLYDDNGYFNALPADVGDSDQQWQRVLNTLDRVRETHKTDLREHRENMRNDDRFFASPFALEESDDSEANEDGETDSATEEVPYKNHLNGQQKVSGGSGKSPASNSVGKESMEVKTDELPGYCDPPNPCPIGVDPETLPAPCDANIPNTKTFNKQWIWTKMQNGECSCDSEHMSSCPRGSSGSRMEEGDDTEKRHPHVHRSVVKKAGPYSAI